MAEFVCPFCDRVNETAPDDADVDPMIDCPACGGAHLHRRYPSDLDEISARRVAELIDDGCSAAEAVDYLATVEASFTQTEWAVRRGTTQQAVSDNVAGARGVLDDE